jgi:hypothetical protein
MTILMQIGEEELRVLKMFMPNHASARQYSPT